MSIWIKNIDTIDHYYEGQLIEDGTFFEVETHRQISFSNNDDLLDDIANSKAQIGSSGLDADLISGTAKQINHLKGKNVVVDNPALDVPGYVKLKTAFVVSTQLITISNTTETDVLLLKHPGSETKPLLITHLAIGTDSASCRTIAKFYSNPTITTDGTALTEQNTFVMGSPPTPESDSI